MNIVTHMIINVRPYSIIFGHIRNSFLVDIILKIELELNKKFGESFFLI